MNRTQRIAQVQRLRKKGLLQKEIAAKLGLSTSYIGDLLSDPDGLKNKARRERYRGTCKTCGEPTDGANGRAKAPEYCYLHGNTAYFKFWTKSRIVAAIHEWNHIHGEPPVATDWNRAVEGSPGQYVKEVRSEKISRRRWPSVQNLQSEFGSWANAIEAAGFPRPKVGHYRDESQRGDILTRWTRERIIAWMQENAIDGVGPSSYGKTGKPIKAAVKQFGSWVNAVEAAGLKPRGIARSTRQ